MQRTSTWAKPNLKLCSLMEILCENKQYPRQIFRDGFVKFYDSFWRTARTMWGRLLFSSMTVSLLFAAQNTVVCIFYLLSKCFTTDNIILAQIIRPPWQYIHTIRTLWGIHAAHPEPKYLYWNVVPQSVLTNSFSLVVLVMLTRMLFSRKPTPRLLI